MNHVLRIALIFGFSGMVVWGQESSTPATTDHGNDEENSKAETQPPDPKLEDSPDDLWTRNYLTGEWGGARTSLEDHGIKLDFRLTQTYQGVASGGSNTHFAYGGKLDIFLTLDGHKAGLWEGFFVNMHAENKFGHSINSDAGGGG